MGRRAAHEGEPSQVVVDELVIGRFRLLERIGSGGMGTVYRAFDERLQREVAVKEIVAGDPQRVLREAQAAARLNHPGIVTLYELGEHRGHALLVSELVHGQTLFELQHAGLLSDRELGEIGLDVCEALAHAHSRGVVHRDVKPQNVIVSADEHAPQRAKLMDFGIARLAGAPTLTAAGEVVGTLAYMSPEQAEGEIAGPESDVYSLALTLYECFSGANPVAGPTPAATARRIGGALPPLREHRPDLPEGLADTIDACLEADPGARPDAPELGECLEAELPALDPANPLPLPEGAEPASPLPSRAGLTRLAILVAAAALLTVLAGPVGGGGFALVVAALLVPLLAIGAPTAALLAPLAPFAALLGATPATPALGAAAPSALARGILGATVWAWVVVGFVGFGAGPDLGIAAEAPAGWAADAPRAAEHVLAALLEPAALAGAALFAVAAVALGWVLAARHLAISLLGALLWGAAVEAGLGLVGNGALAGQPLLVVGAAALAVLVEFRFARADGLDAARAARSGDAGPLERRGLSGRLA